MVTPKAAPPGADAGCDEEAAARFVIAVLVKMDGPRQAPIEMQHRAAGEVRGSDHGAGSKRPNCRTSAPGPLLEANAIANPVSSAAKAKR